MINTLLIVSILGILLWFILLMFAMLYDISTNIRHNIVQKYILWIYSPIIISTICWVLILILSLTTNTN